MQFKQTLRIAAPREKVWELLADTERLNREMGLPSVRYDFLPRAVGGTEMFGTVQMVGITLRYKELPFEWVRPDFYTERRLFAKGPISEFYVNVAFHEEADGQTLVDCTAALKPRSIASVLLVRVFGKKSMGDLAAAWRAFAAYLTGQAKTPFPKHSGQFPADRNRLQRGLTQLLETEADETLARRLAEYLAQAPPEDVTTLRPFALAEAWGFERLAVLRTFLLAASRQGGLLELRWRLLCPSCRGASPENTARTLSAVNAEVHCPSCNIRFDADFDQSVEVCFAVSPAVRPVVEAQYCRGGPQLSPHIHAQFVLEPGESRRVSLAAPPGRYVLVCPQAPASVSLRVEALPADGVTQTPCATLEPHADGQARLLAETRVSAAATWTLVNRTAEMAVLRLESLEPGVPVATAAQVTSLQEFRDQFSSEVLSPGTELAVRQICVLFSDLKGSTAMYRERGDAPSYRAVRDHFAAMRRLVADHDGAIVKTIGDAVMATFTDPTNGLAAALAIQQAARDWTDGLTVKLGLHSGPAIAVNANDLLDYFGKTVNLAARLQSESVGADIVIAAELAEDARIADLLIAHACHLERFTHVIRGFDTPLPMVRITLPVTEPAATA